MSEHVILELIALARTILYVGAGLFLIVFFWWISGKNPIDFGFEFIAEFRELLNGVRSLKSLNALIFILAFIVMTLVFVTPLRDFVLPELTKHEQETRPLGEEGMIAWLICFFLGTGLLCTWVCRFERPEPPDAPPPK